MIRPRVTIAQLMAVVLAAGIGTAVLRNSVQQPREKFEGCELIALDRPDGYVTEADSARGTVCVNVPRRYGTRPGMKMTIFDSGSTTVSVDQPPKGVIELIEIGEQFSTARIIKANRPAEPIRVGDAAYSGGCSPNQPTRFAFIGKIDLNHDGKDDRDEVKRLIEEAGGLIDFDLPPRDVGTESGTISPRIDWYVFDEPASSQRADFPKSGQGPSPPTQFEKRVVQAIKEARLNGIRPMPVGRLLIFLGFGVRQTPLGRPEAANSVGVQPPTGPR
jgi:hypothetical protein